MSYVSAYEWFRLSGGDLGPIMTETYTHFKDRGGFVTKIMHPELKGVVLALHTAYMTHKTIVTGSVTVHEPSAMDGTAPWKTNLYDFNIWLRGTPNHIEACWGGTGSPTRATRCSSGPAGPRSCPSSLVGSRSCS